MQTSETNSAPTETSAKLERSRVGTTWVALGGFTVVLLLLGIFIGQNSQPVQIRYLGLNAQLAFGLALLFAAIAGSILTLLVGSVRIIQLRNNAKKAQSVNHE